MDEHGLSAIPREARELQGQRAGIVTRVFAAAVDLGVVLLTLLVAYAGYASIRFLLDPRGFSIPDPRFIVSLFVGMIVMFVYLTIAWALGGRTYGNLLLGLRVVGVFGGDVGWARAAMRAAFYIGFPVGLFLVAIDRGRRSVQDLVLATRVVHDWRPRVHHRPTMVDP